MATSTIKCKNPNLAVPGYGGGYLYQYTIPENGEISISASLPSCRFWFVTNAIVESLQGAYICGEKSDYTIHAITPIKAASDIAVTYNDGVFKIANNRSNAA
jgi:hypothetical protein